MNAHTDPSASVPDRATIVAALRQASRAPSVHNTQPWQWVFEHDRLHLYSDADRLLTATDPHGRQLTISCGAILHHARTAFGARGWHTDTTRLPSMTEPGHLAEITFRPWDDPPPGLRARADAIEHRRSDRLPLNPPHDWAALQRRLRMLASPHYLELDTLDEDARTRLVTASQQAAAQHRYDMAYQAEIGWWAGHSGDPEGIPAEALVSASEFARVGVGRDFPSTPHSERRPGLTDRAGLVVLSSEGDSPLTWLRTGEALSAVLLECTASGEASCALTHITEFPSGRAVLTELLPPSRTPQVVIRIGSATEGEPVTMTARRPIEETSTFR